MPFPAASRLSQSLYASHVGIQVPGFEFFTLAESKTFVKLFFRFVKNFFIRRKLPLGLVSVVVLSPRQKSSFVDALKFNAVWVNFLPVLLGRGVQAPSSTQIPG
jgi:hypothetical protein